MTITLQDDFAVQASEEYDFTNENGFVIPTRGDGTLSSLWNFGTISLTVDSDVDVPQYGYHVIQCAAGIEGGVIHNAAGAVIEATCSVDVDLTGIDEYTTGPEIINEGVIRLDSAYVANGIRVYGSEADQTVNNSGLLQVHGDEGGGGISFQYGGTIINSGTIKVTGGGAWGLSPGLFEWHIENTGKIICRATDAPASVGVSIYQFWDGATFVNEGLIRADFAIKGDVSGHEIANAGKLIGDVWLYGGNEGFANTGLIRGDVLLGGYDDHYDGADGKLFGAVYGGGGADLLVCGKGDQVLHGDGIPQAGDDGADTLIGGLGSDTLEGGGGSDVFVFQSLADSKVGHEDLIQALSSKDVIDLSEIDADTTVGGDQAFHLVGALGGHTGEAALAYDAELKLTLLQLDVDGDGVADAQIAMTGDRSDFTNFVL